MPNVNDNGAPAAQQPPKPLTIAFVLYPGFTALDIIGPFEVLASVPEELERRGAHYTKQRVVARGKVITAAGVSAGIDMALTLLARLHGPQIAQGVQLALEYDPQPPFGTGSPSKAPAELVEFVRWQLNTLGMPEPASTG
jgi:transcriptional regulator GlxA family with amidase domain